ncbi:MAG: gamma-glutamyl-gamma-aminobutyrate hydrolase family protein [Bacteroidales bacterium]|nr:gamma-glutamyl-gamma-aminobutyrate hydrolase family protein [Bacteroidales bacterium]MBN2755756.1 gamma-glutamyl-gamma-aminobutyrate hydrolase family protein [Bacteroidales bacterium]
MKKTLILLSILLTFSFNFSFANIKIANLDTTRIALVNPGVFYLKSLTFLSDNRYIDINRIQYQAVFYSKSEVSFEEAEQYITDNEIKNIKLFKIEGDLNQNNLYKENSCTKSFYEIFKNSDGIIFLGGWDLPPATYNQKTNLLTNIVTPNRHYFELSFLFHLLGGSQNQNHKAFLDENPNYVVSGICLGLQTMNVATGGDLYQDIPSEVYNLKYAEDVLNIDENNRHRNYWVNINKDSSIDNHSFHKIKLINNQLFTDRLKLKADYQPTVCSSHHQAIKNLSNRFKVAATSIDGKIIEAISHKKFKNVFGVQFHPEFYTLYDSESKKVKMKPSEETLMTEYEILEKHESFDFHVKYWEFFSSLFKKQQF